MRGEERVDMLLWRGRRRGKDRGMREARKAMECKGMWVERRVLCI